MSTWSTERRKGERERHRKMKRKTKEGKKERREKRKGIVRRKKEGKGRRGMAKCVSSRLQHNPMRRNQGFLYTCLELCCRLVNHWPWSILRMKHRAIPSSSSSPHTLVGRSNNGKCFFFLTFLCKMLTPRNCFHYTHHSAVIKLFFFAYLYY